MECHVGCCMLSDSLVGRKKRRPDRTATARGQLLVSQIYERRIARDGSMTSPSSSRKGQQTQAVQNGGVVFDHHELHHHHMSTAAARLEGQIPHSLHAGCAGRNEQCALRFCPADSLRQNNFLQFPLCALRLAALVRPLVRSLICRALPRRDALKMARLTSGSSG
eukprot:scaffold110886_cov28-Prasinocladus_malaysianus.AAC.1